MTVFGWRGLNLREVAAPLTPLARASRAGTGLSNVATEEGQGFGTLRKRQYDVDRFDVWEVLRSSNNGGCIIARLLDLTKLIRGVALHVISGQKLRFNNRRCECDRSDYGCED